MSETTISRPSHSSMPQNAGPEKPPVGKRPWFWAVLVVVLAGVVAGVVAISTGGADSAADPTSASDAAAKPSDGPAPSVGDVGKPVDAGGLQFTVSGLDCSTVTDKGKTCLVAVQVENTGTAAQTLAADAQYLIDAKGKRYAADSAAPTGEKSASLFREFAAGDSAEGQLMFTVPAEAEPQKVELSGSASSTPVVLTLWSE